MIRVRIRIEKITWIRIRIETYPDPKHWFLKGQNTSHVGFEDNFFKISSSKFVNNFCLCLLHEELGRIRKWIRIRKGYGSGSEIIWKVGSGSEKNYFGSTTLNKTHVTCILLDPWVTDSALWPGGAKGNPRLNRCLSASGDQFQVET